MADDIDFGEDEEQKGGKKKLILIVVIALVVILAAAGGVLFFLMGGDSQDPEAQKAAEEAAAKEAYAAQPPVFYEIERPFVMNYLIKERQRYLQVSIAFKVRDKKIADFLEAHEPSLKTYVNKVLAGQDFSEIRTPSGKEDLREAIKQEVDEFLKAESDFPHGVDEVLYTNFVMQ